MHAKIRHFIYHMHGVECMLKIIPTLAHHLNFSETEILTIGTESERT